MLLNVTLPGFFGDRRWPQRLQCRCPVRDVSDRSDLLRPEPALVLAVRADQLPGQQQRQHDARAGDTLARANPSAPPSADPRARPRDSSSPSLVADTEPSATGRALARDLSNTPSACAGPAIRD